MNKITNQRFSQLLDIYGGNSNHWPVEERAAALKLLQESAEAYRLQQAALNLDNLLDSVPISSPTAMLRQRILDQHYKEPIQDAWQWFVQWLMGTSVREHFLRPALVFVIPLVFGIFLGLNLETASMDENMLFAEEVNLLALSSTE
ncbi:MAG: hypothetical protein IMF12_02240 [Proteobacteria bacterium]|nr:hypothetical protein [Pseudomonadota bacterium]